MLQKIFWSITWFLCRSLRHCCRQLSNFLLILLVLKLLRWPQSQCKPWVILGCAFRCHHFLMILIQVTKSVFESMTSITTLICYVTSNSLYYCSWYSYNLTRKAEQALIWGWHESNSENSYFHWAYLYKGNISFLSESCSWLDFQSSPVKGWYFN